ncbi:MAG: sulfide/dihydroorotate dehydrogenase-like FAD/NAD-binding protein [Clostridia bacterium]|nr:sulfide/dihydroorotate dehydrogenase-like FAD/NAD-binding protein [Clostridia bacterium]
MYKIVSKRFLNSSVCEISVYAPLVAKKAKAGQFIILRVDDNGERIPLTIAGFDRDKGTINVIFQVVGASTEKLKNLNVEDSISDFVGPLGNATEIGNEKKVCVVGGGVGCAIAYPVAKAFYENGTNVSVISGFRNKEFVILEDEFKNVSNNFICVTDDGSYGEKGNVCVPLEKMLESGESFDKIIAIGPIVMMKFVSKLAEKYNIPCIVSMNPIMIDGTGMCGGCRLTVDGKVKFACIDGPEFDGLKVDFDELLTRNNMYGEFERHAYKETCNLLNKEAE